MAATQQTSNGGGNQANTDFGKFVTDGTAKIDTLITTTKNSGTYRLCFGTLLFILAVGLMGWVSSQHPNEKPSVCCCECCPTKYDARQCCGGCCPSILGQSGSSTYVFIAIASLSLVGSIVLLSSYASSVKKIGALEKEYVVLRDIVIAWRVAKGLPEQQQKEQCKTVKVTDEKNLKKITTETITTKEWIFPRQKAKSQIIETLLARCTN